MGSQIVPTCQKGTVSNNDSLKFCDSAQYHSLPDHPSFTTWLQTWPGENDKNHGKFILEGTNTDDVEFAVYGPGFVLQNQEASYSEVMMFQEREMGHLFPRSSKARNKHFSMLVDPVNFTIQPPSKIIAQPGSDVKMAIQFIYKKNHNKRFDRDHIETRIHQHANVIQEDSPYFTYNYTPIFENNTEFSYWPDEQNNNPKIPVELTEEMIGNNEIRVTINVLMKHVQKGDDCLILSEITKMPVKYNFVTQFLVAPNTELYPSGYLGVYMYSSRSASGDPGSPIGFVIGKDLIINCYGIGNDLSDIYLLKNGHQIETEGENLVYHFSKTDYWMDVMYTSNNASELVAGEYSCILEGEFGSVRTDRTLMVIEEIQSTISMSWWNDTQVIQYVR